MSAVLILEGTWEEIAAHAAELAGRRVRVTVLDTEDATMRQTSGAYQPSALIETPEFPAPFDLPRPGKAVIVKAHPGGLRLPDPPAEWPQGD